jgi:predicted transport protein
VQASSELRTLYGSLQRNLLSLGDNVREGITESHFVFRRVKNAEAVRYSGPLTMQVGPGASWPLRLGDVSIDHSVDRSHGWDAPIPSGKDFASVVARPQTNKLIVYAQLDPSKTKLTSKFTRDVHTVRHAGVGDLEITIRSESDIEKAEPLLARSYRGR